MNNEIVKNLVATAIEQWNECYWTDEDRSQVPLKKINPNFVNKQSACGATFKLMFRGLLPNDLSFNVVMRAIQDAIGTKASITAEQLPK